MNPPYNHPNDPYWDLRVKVKEKPPREKKKKPAKIKLKTIKQKTEKIKRKTNQGWRLEVKPNEYLLKLALAGERLPDELT